MSKWCVVVPTVRPDSLVKFMEAWKDLFNKHKVIPIIINDSPRHLPLSIITITALRNHPTAKYYFWEDIEADLGDKHHIIPTRTDCIRSYGFYKAWQQNHDYILTLDDDVYPVEGVDPFEEYEKVFEKGTLISEYFNVGELLKNNELPMRGFPLRDRTPQKVMLQYGMWQGVPDLDGITQLSHQGQEFDTYRVNITVPKGCAVTGCIMNCAFRREFVPNFYQLLMGEEHGYDRWGDIWSGLIAKKICDENNWGVVMNGKATVHHSRASNTQANIKKEASGLQLNEHLWSHLNDFDSCSDYLSAVDTMAYLFEATDNSEYARRIREVSKLWTSLF